MNRRAWHLISTGHRSKDGADVICIFYNGEAIECYYDSEYESYSWDALFIPNSLEPNKEIKQVNVRPADYIEDDY